VSATLTFLVDGSLVQQPRIINGRARGMRMPTPGEVIRDAVDVGGAVGPIATSVAAKFGAAFGMADPLQPGHEVAIKEALALARALAAGTESVADYRTEFGSFRPGAAALALVWAAQHPGCELDLPEGRVVSRDEAALRAACPLPRPMWTDRDVAGLVWAAASPLEEIREVARLLVL